MEVEVKTLSYWFIEDQILVHFGMPRGAKMNLALNELKHHLPACTPSQNRLLTLYAEQPMESHRGQSLATKTSIEVKDINPNVRTISQSNLSAI